MSPAALQHLLHQPGDFPALRIHPFLFCEESGSPSPSSPFRAWDTKSAEKSCMLGHPLLAFGLWKGASDKRAGGEESRQCVGPLREIPSIVVWDLPGAV